MNTNKKLITLSKNSVLNQQIVNELEELLACCPPRELRQTLHELFFGFLKSLDMELVDRNFKEITIDYYLLYRFLERAEVYH